jgi:phage terminase large subunit-like protein
VRAADVIRFIERYCFVPEGAHVGQPLRLRPWQKSILRSIYDNPAGPTRRAIISMGRKGGKSCLSAAILLAHLCGPPARLRPNSELYSAAQSRDQAAIIFSLACKMIRMSPVLSDAVRIMETAKTLVCPELGVKYRALSAEANTAYGLSPSLILHDEIGRVRGPRSELYEALETATAAQSNPLSLLISTQASSADDLLSILIDDAKAGHDPHTVLRLFSAPLHLDPFSERAIRAANPAFGAGGFQNRHEVLAMARDAKRMKSREAQYRNLILNQRVETVAPFLSRDTWLACGAAPMDVTGHSVFGGLDLSSVDDLTALVLGHCDPRDGVWHVKPYFWLPEEHLLDKATRDRAPYDQWHAEGYLETTPGPAISPEHVAERIKEIFAEHVVAKIGFDPWHWPSFRPWLLRAGFPESLLDRAFAPFPQTYKALSPALRDLESLVLRRRIAHGDHPVLSMCMSNATIETDVAGNRRLSKKRSRGRIDGAVALCMCIGCAPMQARPVDISTLIA